MQIGDRTVVSFDYTLTDDGGQVLDSSRGAQPLTYLHGAGSLIPGLETAMAGRGAGDAFQVTIAPGDAYGDHDPSLVQMADRSQFPAEARLEVGMRFEGSSSAGKQVWTVSEVREDRIVLDGNHPLAGRTLHFDVEIREVRAATIEELRHGHSHGPGGAHD